MEHKIKAHTADNHTLTSVYLLLLTSCPRSVFFFFFNDTPPPEIYPLPLHDALPIFRGEGREPGHVADTSVRVMRLHEQTLRNAFVVAALFGKHDEPLESRFVGDAVSHSFAKSAATDRKSTRLNSSHLVISYAVFCLK